MKKWSEGLTILYTIFFIFMGI
ncbi:hypothetical protein LCGC14_2828480, partial [marine sediment metagenome]